VKRLVSWVAGRAGFEVTRVDGDGLARRFGEIPGMVSPQAGVMLYLLALAAGPEGDIVEIGSWLGRSTAFLAQACEDADNGVVHAVDSFRGNPGRPSGAQANGRDIEAEFRANIARVGLSHRVVVHAKPSSEARAEIEGPLRMLFVDGEHTYDAVTTDLAYAELLLPGGMIAVDDCSRPEVDRAVLEFLSRGGYSAPFRQRGMLVARRSS
jgi:predicted O-methyltransferase YrrM